MSLFQSQQVHLLGTFRQINDVEDISIILHKSQAYLIPNQIAAQNEMSLVNKHGMQYKAVAKEVERTEIISG